MTDNQPPTSRVDITADQATIGGDVTGRDKITYEAPAPVALSLHQLPAPPGDFTGREAELAELCERLGAGATISGLQGMGGVGKTALALKLAEGLMARYPDAQFFLDLRGTTTPLSPAEAMAHVIRGYHPTAKLPESEDELRGLYRTVLHGQRALLVMDNARDAAQVEPLIPPAGCALLVTSRWHFALPGLLAKNLDTLPVGDAEGLLLKIAPRVDGHAGEMAKLCGYLPLALRLAGTALAERMTLSVGEYVGRLQDAQRRLELVEASLTLSYELLTPELERLWGMLAVFPGTFDRAGAAAVWGMDAAQDAAQEALDELVRYSLLEWNETAGRYSLHDLVRVFAGARLGEGERDAAQGRHAAHYEGVLRAANELYMQGGESILRGLGLFDLEWGNIQAGQAWAAGHAGEDDEAARLCCDYPGAGPYCLNLRQHSRDWIGWQEAGLAAARRLKHRRAEGVYLGNLGIAYDDLGDARRAIELYEQGLVIAREIGDRRSESKSLGNIGNAYRHLGDARKAIEYHDQALVIAREIGDRQWEGGTLFNMSLALDKLGERAQALVRAKAALEIFEQIESPHVETVRKQLAEWDATD